MTLIGIFFRLLTILDYYVVYCSIILSLAKTKSSCFGIILNGLVKISYICSMSFLGYEDKTTWKRFNSM